MRLPSRTIHPPVERLTLDRAEVMRLLGYQPGKTLLTPVVERILDRGIALTIAAAQPAAVISYCSVDAAAEGEVRLAVPGLAWQSAGLARLLRGASGVSLVAATLGEGVELLVRQLFAEQDYATATVVDATGSALIHALVRHAEALVAAEAGAAGCKPTSLFCPGYADWALQAQPLLVAQAGGNEIGLTCTDTCYLTPQKSLVGLIGWAAEGARLPASGCTACGLTTCSYRKVNAL